MREFFYRRKDTRFHNLGPGAKSLAVAAIVAMSLLLDEPLALLALFALTAAIVLEARIARGWLFYMKIAAWIGATIFLLNLLLNQGGETVLLRARLGLPLFQSLRITLESVFFGLVMALRMAAVMSAFAVFSLTVSPDQLMRLMRRLRVPEKSVFLTSLAARFVPSLLDDVDVLTQVQKARGAKLRGVRGKGPVIIPLLSNSLERSVTVAEAMEARGFGSGSGVGLGSGRNQGGGEE